MKTLAFASALLLSAGAFALPAAANPLQNGSYTSSQSSGYVDTTDSPYSAGVAAYQTTPEEHAGSFTSTMSSGYPGLAGDGQQRAGKVLTTRTAAPVDTGFVLRKQNGSYTSTQSSGN